MIDASSLKKVKSILIEKEYWLSLEETEVYEKDGLPVFSPSDTQLIQAHKKTITKDELLMIWGAKANMGQSAKETMKMIKELRAKMKEEDHVHILNPGLNPLTQHYLSEIYKTLGKKCISGKKVDE